MSPLPPPEAVTFAEPMSTETGSSEPSPTSTVPPLPALMSPEVELAAVALPPRPVKDAKRNVGPVTTPLLFSCRVPPLPPRAPEPVDVTLPPLAVMLPVTTV